MQAVRLHGPRDFRLEELPEPSRPGTGQALVGIRAVGICGSDMHMYQDARIGDTRLETPMVLGHEFGGVVVDVGEGALDGFGQPLTPGKRVAVEPAVACHRCELCEAGHPNLCPNHYFYGLYPHDGALQERMLCEARNLFPVPDSISDAGVTLLETLGVAIHAVDLGRLKVARSVAVIGCGPVGLLILRLAKLSGADPLYAFDLHPWRAEKAKAWGATEAWTPEDGDPQALIKEHTGGRGVDVAFEAAWADHSVQLAADLLRYGGRLVLVGIPGNDQFCLQHSTARRKGLSIIMSRRMKHTYPRAIHLATRGKDVLDLDDLVSHHVPLKDTAKAFEMNTRYDKGVHKIIVHVSEG